MPYHTWMVVSSLGLLLPVDNMLITVWYERVVSDLVPIPAPTLMVWNIENELLLNEVLMQAAVMSSWSLEMGVASRR